MVSPDIYTHDQIQPLISAQLGGIVFYNIYMSVYVCHYLNNDKHIDSHINTIKTNSINGHSPS